MVVGVLVCVGDRGGEIFACLLCYKYRYMQEVCNQSTAALCSWYNRQNDCVGTLDAPMVPK